MRDYPNGVCTVSLIENSPTEMTIPRHEYARLYAEWTSGAAFLTWTGHFGQTVTVKGARVEMITDWSPDAWADCVALTKEEALKGDIS